MAAACTCIWTADLRVTRRGCISMGAWSESRQPIDGQTLRESPPPGTPSPAALHGPGKGFLEISQVRFGTSKTISNLHPHRQRDQRPSSRTRLLADLPTALTSCACVPRRGLRQRARDRASHRSRGPVCRIPIRLATRTCFRGFASECCVTLEHLPCAAWLPGSAARPPTAHRTNAPA